MFDTLYIEEAVREHPRTVEILQRFKDRQVVECRHYGELFNARQQNFRLQKTRPALILANKQGKRVLPAPSGYGIGAQHNYYFSHMLNCIYDCRYCFLQGMYRSAHTVLFVNYEDFIDDIKRAAKQHADEAVHIFSGYDGDSLALEPLSGFAEQFIAALRDVPNIWLELRTKSTQIRGLLDTAPWPNCIVAYSFTPPDISAALEHKVPKFEQRLAAIKKLQDKGWPVGLRFDPLIYSDDFELQYRGMFEKIFGMLDGDKIHSISFGPFRMPEKFYQQMVSLYPQEKLFAGAMHKQAGMMTYPTTQETMMREACEQLLLQHVSAEQLFPCLLD